MNVRVSSVLALSLVSLSLLLVLNDSRLSAKSDGAGDPLPQGAVARIGSVRLRHERAVTSLAVSPDGGLLASAGEGPSVRLNELPSGRLLGKLRLPAHGDACLRVAFRPDGKALAVVLPTEIGMFDPATETWFHEVPVPTGACATSAAFAPDGKTLAVTVEHRATGKAGLLLLDSESGAPLKELDLGTTTVSTVAVSRDGRRLACGAGKTARVADLEREELVLALETPSNVNAVAFSPDGKELATASEDGSVLVFRVATGEKTRSLPKHEAVGHAVAFSPDGKFLATACGDESVRLFDAATGSLSREIACHRKGSYSSVQSLAFTPDGKTLVAGTSQGSVRLFDVASGRPLEQPFSHEGTIRGLAWSPDGKTLATSAYGTQLLVFDLASGKSRALEPGGGRPLAFSPDGKLLAAGSGDGAVLDATSGTVVMKLGRLGDAVAFSPSGKTIAESGMRLVLYDVAERRELLTSSLPPGRGVAFSPDGATLAVGVEGGIAILDSAGAQLRKISGHKGDIRGVAFSPDGQTVASAGADGTVRLAKSSGPEVWCSRRLSDFGGIQASSVAFSPDGRTIAAGFTDDHVLTFEASSGALLEDLSGHEGGVECVAFSPDGTRIASGSQDGTVLIWQVHPGTRIEGTEAPWKRGAREDDVDDSKRRAESVIFAPSGALLARCDHDLEHDGLFLWDAKSHDARRYLVGRSGLSAAIVLSRDQSFLALPRRSHLELIDPGTGKAIRTLDGHTDSIAGVALSPDGETLASAGSDKTIVIWDPKTGDRRRVIRGDRGFESIAYSPDGKTLAAASFREIRVYDAASGELRRTLRGQLDQTYALAFSPDGNTLATGSIAGTVCVFDLGSGTLLRRIEDLDADAAALAFTPDGKTLIVGARGIHFYDLSTGALTRKWRMPPRDPPRNNSFRGDAVRSLSLSLDGSALATVWDDGSLSVWDMKAGTPTFQTVTAPGK